MPRKLLVSLHVALLLVLVSAEADPSYYEACGRRDPNLDQCVLDSITKLLTESRNGIPELDVPSLYPLTIDEIQLTNFVDLRTTARNVQINGLTDYKVKFFHIDLEQQTIDVEVVFPQVRVRTDISAAAQFLFRITENGFIDTTAVDIKVTAKIKFETPVRDGVRLIFISEVSSLVIVTDYSAKYRSATRNAFLTRVVNYVLQNSRREIILIMRPILNRAVNQKLPPLVNNYLKHFTYDELLPDRL